MKQRPLLMTVSMALAALERRKTETRRQNGLDDLPAGATFDQLLAGGPDSPVVAAFTSTQGARLLRPCPYGRVGDQLYVRETTQLHSESSSGLFALRYLAGDQVREFWRKDTGPITPPYRWAHKPGEPARGKVVPNIHMPRWAVRTVLEITEIAVQRLQDMTQRDAVAEGIDELMLCAVPLCPPRCAGEVGCYRLLDAFKDLWESINGKGSWDANPWVWVVRFRVVDHD